MKFISPSLGSLSLDAVFSQIQEYIAKQPEEEYRQKNRPIPCPAATILSRDHYPSRWPGAGILLPQATCPDGLKQRIYYETS